MSAVDTIKSAIVGNPFDANKKPSRQGVIQAFAEMQMQLEAAQAGAFVRDTRANLNALLVAPVSAMAWVVADGTPANNGIYQNTGSASAAVWTRRTSIPQFLITGINTGEGSANAIKVTADLAVPTQDGRALFLIPIVETTTAGTCSVQINNGTVYPIKTASGNDPASGGLTANMIIAGFISGGNFRMITDQASAAIQAAAEAAQAAAEAAAEAAEEIAGGTFATEAEALAGLITDKWMSPATTKAVVDAGGVSSAAIVSSILNGDGYIWPTRPRSGVTPDVTAFAINQISSGWYGGAGPGAQYNFQTVPVPPGSIPGNPACMMRFVWAASPTAGNTIDYPGTGWNTYLEQFVLHQPRKGMGKTFTCVFWARQTRTLYPDPIPARLLYWYSAGGYPWSSGMTVYANEHFYHNGYSFKVVTGGTMDSTAPTIPANQGAAANENRGSATIICVGPMKGNAYELFEAAAVVGDVKVATGEPPPSRVIEIAPGSTYQKFVRTITMPEIGYVNSTDYAATDWPVRTLIPPQRYSAIPYFGFGIDLDIIDIAPEVEMLFFDAEGTDEPDMPSPDALNDLMTSAVYPPQLTNLFITQIDRVAKVKGRYNGNTAAPIGSSSYHVGSFGKGATGNYSVTFASPAPNADYVVDIPPSNDGTNNCIFVVYAKSTSGFGILSFNLSNLSGGLIDCLDISFSVTW